jgi:hypothetical protein
LDHQVQKATPVITWTNPAAITYPTALSSTQLNATADVPGTFVYTPASGTVLAAGMHQALKADFTPTDTANYNLATKTVYIDVNKGTPVITWANPATITYPTALSGTQLNATADVPGSFAYTPAAGTILNAGNAQTLQTLFTPTDIANYNTAIKNVSIDVLNTAPIITMVSGPLPVPVGSTGLASADLIVTFTDPGIPSDTFTISSTWTSSSGVRLNFGGVQQPGYDTTTGTAKISASGLDDGVYVVVVKVKDRFNGESSPFEYRYVVVYDPNGGFVTGGGWIDSPLTACQPNVVAGVCTTQVTGKATFGFVSKYLKGQTKPTGNTEFQFQAGNLNFKSTDYDWLIVNGTIQAQYKGTGMINGTGSFGFILTSQDGDNFGAKKPDSFRIKIWDKVSGNIVYDNQMGVDETSLTAGTQLGGGSIVIHNK